MKLGRTTLEALDNDGQVIAMVGIVDKFLTRKAVIEVAMNRFFTYIKDNDLTDQITKFKVSSDFIKG